MARTLIIFEVTPDGAESFDVHATSRDVGQWERLPPVKGQPPNTLSKFESAPAMSDLETVCWLAMQRLARTDPDFVMPDGVTDLKSFRASCDVDGRPPEAGPNGGEDGDEGPTRLGL